MITFLLSLQSWARDNTVATTWPCFQAKNGFRYGITYIFIVFGLFLVSEAQLRYPIVVFAELKNIVACPALFP